MFVVWQETASRDRTPSSSILVSHFSSTLVRTETSTWISSTDCSARSFGSTISERFLSTRYWTRTRWPNWSSFSRRSSHSMCSKQSWSSFSFGDERNRPTRQEPAVYFICVTGFICSSWFCWSIVSSRFVRWSSKPIDRSTWVSIVVLSTIRGSRSRESWTKQVRSTSIVSEGKFSRAWSTRPRSNGWSRNSTRTSN